MQFKEFENYRNEFGRFSFEFNDIEYPLFMIFAFSVCGGIMLYQFMANMILVVVLPSILYL